MKRPVLVGVLSATLLSPAAAAAATENDFLVHTTADIVDLCSVTPSDPLYTAAVHFCQGYLIGAFQYHLEASEALGLGKICLPAPPPTRNEGIQMFIAWTRQNPQFWSERPVDTMVRFLETKWACRS